MPALSRCLDRFSPSKIVEMWDMAQQLKREGHRIYDLSSGEPDFATDPAACTAGHAAIDSGDTKYTAVDGTLAMKAAIRGKFLKEGHIEYPDSCLAAGNGAKPLLANIIMTLVNPGDEVIIPGPCWSSHPGMVQSIGGEATIAECSIENGYKLTASALNAAITKSTRALLMCTPVNPTGAVYNQKELASLAEVLRAHPDIWIVMDEIYSEITFDDVKHVSMATVAPDLIDRIITINGVSKSYAMTGWRIGYAAGSQLVMEGLRKLMSQVTGSPSSISQAAAIAALDGPRELIAERRQIYQSRRDKVMERLNAIPQLKVLKPDGAFYLYVDCSGALGQTTQEGQVIESSVDLGMYFLKKFNVAIVPAEAFEARAGFRLSIASSKEELDGACAGIADACHALSDPLS